MRGDDAADQLHQAGADQVPDAFGVGHDARDQDAGLGRVEVADRQPHDVRLDARRMSVIARCAATPSTCESANEVTAWTSVAAPAASASGSSSSGALLPDDVVDQVLRGRRQHEPARRG